MHTLQVPKATSPVTSARSGQRAATAAAAEGNGSPMSTQSSQAGRSPRGPHSHGEQGGTGASFRMATDGGNQRHDGVLGCISCHPECLLQFIYVAPPHHPVSAAGHRALSPPLPGGPHSVNSPRGCPKPPGGCSGAHRVPSAGTWHWRDTEAEESSVCAPHPGAEEEGEVKGQI